MAPKLRKVFTLRGYLDPKGIIDAGPLRGDNGPRQIVAPIPSGYLEGSGVRAELLPGSGDWQTVRTTLSSIEFRHHARVAPNIVSYSRHHPCW